MKISFCIYFLLLFAFVELRAQGVAYLSGNVSDTSGVGLDFAHITVVNLGKDKGVFSDVTGNYKMIVPAKKPLIVVVSYTGFLSDTLRIELKENQQHNYSPKLVRTGVVLPQVFVEDMYTRSVGIVRIPAHNLQQIAGPSKGVEVLVKSLEGVSSNNELSSQYSVRGGNFDENLIYVNDMEIYRPLLIRNGQQEGLSFINPDMVSDIVFSSGGFEAFYGDKMSSVLDIKYSKPMRKFGGSFSTSLLGSNLHFSGRSLENKFVYSIGFRHKTNKYLFNAMETKGEYQPSFVDLQTFFAYQIGPKTELSFLGNYANNYYRFTPSTRETEFGNMYEVYRLKIYFNGQEVDHFQTCFGALLLEHKPEEELRLKFITSLFSTKERETYDIQGQYWLYETGAMGQEVEQEELFDRGVGTYIEHARNQLRSLIYNVEHKGVYDMSSGSLKWGLKYQYEAIVDRLNEWKMIDSAGSTVPSIHDIPGQPNLPLPPSLLNVVKAKNTVVTNRISAYLQKQWIWQNAKSRWGLVAGVRSQYASWTNNMLVSPRMVLSFKPMTWTKDIVFRLSTGVYGQPAFYREFRDPQGRLNQNIRAQKSFHIVLSEDFSFQLYERPFKFTTSLYYKYMWDLIPFEMENVRLRYEALNSAFGYATGLDLRLFGEFIEGIDSWATLSLLSTKENIAGDGHGYLPRPTDRLLNASIYFQDYVPRYPNIRMNLNFNFGTGLPFGPPNTERWQQTQRMPSYMRVDIGSSFCIKDGNTKWGKGQFLKLFKKVWLNAEVFNLFNNQNTISYLWVSDYGNYHYGVPNYLTPRQLNVRLSFEF